MFKKPDSDTDVAVEFLNTYITSEVDFLYVQKPNHCNVHKMGNLNNPVKFDVIFMQFIKVQDITSRAMRFLGFFRMESCAEFFQNHD